MLEPTTLDFDDVASVIVTVVRRLLFTRIDDFQLQMMQAISDISEPLIHADRPMHEDFMTQIQHQSDIVPFEKQREHFGKKLES